MEWYDLISFRSKRCAYTYMCKHVCMTCFRITTLSKHVGISSAPKTWWTTSSFASNQKTECNICQNTPAWLKTYEKHKKTTFYSFFMPWFQKNNETPSTYAPVHLTIFPFRQPFSKPKPPGFKIRLVTDVIAWGESLRMTEEPSQ